MNNFWTVAIDTSGRVFLENEKLHGIQLFLEGRFKSNEEKILFASNLARQINGTYKLPA